MKRTDRERIESAVSVYRASGKTFSPSDVAAGLGIVTKQVTAYLKECDDAYRVHPAYCRKSMEDPAYIPSAWAFRIGESA